MKNLLLRRVMLTAALLSMGIAGAAERTVEPQSDVAIAEKLRHEIRMYSRYTIWDN